MKIRRNNSLSRKIVLTIVAFVSICIVVAALMLTNNMKESMIKVRSEMNRQGLSRSHRQLIRPMKCAIWRQRS